MSETTAPGQTVAPTAPGPAGEPVPPEPARLPPELEARFEPVRTLGRGGMGIVYLARDRQVEREVALKLILRPTALLTALFRQEARLLGGLEHPRVVRLYEYGLADRRILALSGLDGHTLWASDAGSEARPLVADLRSSGRCDVVLWGSVARALDGRTGQPLFRLVTGSPTAAAVAWERAREFPPASLYASPVAGPLCAAWGDGSGPGGSSPIAPVGRRSRRADTGTVSRARSSSSRRRGRSVQGG